MQQAANSLRVEPELIENSYTTHATGCKQPTCGAGANRKPYRLRPERVIGERATQRVSRKRVECGTVRDPTTPRTGFWAVPFS